MVFSTNDARITGYPHAKELSWVLTSHHIPKINSKWNKDISVKTKTIKLLEENIGIIFRIQDQAMISQLRAKTQAIKGKKRTDKLYNTFNKVKRQTTKWEKTFANHMLDNGQCPEYIKNVYNLTTKDK